MTADPETTQLLADLAQIDADHETLRLQTVALADERALKVQDIYDRACTRRINATGSDHGARADTAKLLGVTLPQVARSLNRAAQVRAALAAGDPW